MYRLFKLIFKLYPADYRNAFYGEMLSVLNAAAAEHRAKGRLAYAGFVFKETAGLLIGAVRERRTVHTDARTEATWATTVDASENTLPEDFVQCRRRVTFFRRRMVNAIAAHDFVKARLYSGQDNAEREILLQLRRKYNLGPDAC